MNHGPNNVRDSTLPGLDRETVGQHSCHGMQSFREYVHSERERRLVSIRQGGGQYGPREERGAYSRLGPMTISGSFT